MYQKYVNLVEEISSQKVIEALDPVDQKPIVQLINDHRLDFEPEQDSENPQFKIIKPKIDTMQVPISLEQQGRGNTEDDRNREKKSEAIKETEAMIKNMCKAVIKKQGNTVKAFFKHFQVEPEDKKLILNSLLEEIYGYVHSNLVFVEKESKEVMDAELSRELLLKKASAHKIYVGLDSQNNEVIKMYSKKFDLGKYGIGEYLEQNGFEEVQSQTYVDYMMRTHQKSS